MSFFGGGDPENRSKWHQRCWGSFGTEELTVRTDPELRFGSCHCPSLSAHHTALPESEQSAWESHPGDVPE
eukprot:4373639-Pyramimonas_sp.AAC.1